MEQVKVGDASKEFTLMDQQEKEVKLSEFTGKKVLLSFHPLAWTKVCGEQMQSLEQHRGELEKLNTVPLGISVDSIPCKSAWARELDIQETELLADFWPHGRVAAAYGMFREQNGFAQRANIIIDEEGKVVFVKVYPIKELPDIDEILQFLRSNSQ